MIKCPEDYYPQEESDTFSRTERLKRLRKWCEDHQFESETYAIVLAAFEIMEGAQP